MIKGSKSILKIVLVLLFILSPFEIAKPISNHSKLKAAYMEIGLNDQEIKQLFSEINSTIPRNQGTNQIKKECLIPKTLLAVVHAGITSLAIISNDNIMAQITQLTKIINPRTTLPDKAIRGQIYKTIATILSPEQEYEIPERADYRDNDGDDWEEVCDYGEDEG